MSASPLDLVAKTGFSMRMNVFESGSVLPVTDVAAFERLAVDAIPVWGDGADPVLVVTPSRSLQRHWIRLLAKARGAVIGIEVLTYTGLVGRILEGAGLKWFERKHWVDHQIRKMASEEPVLNRSLGDLEDGLELIVRVVHELLDAGFQSAHGEGILDAIRTWPSRPSVGVGSGVAPRVAAVVRVAKGISSMIEELDCPTLGTAIDLAIDTVARHGRTACPHRGLLFVGFCDATAKVADLIEASQRHLDASVAIETPPNPCRPGEVDPGVEFARVFHQRFEGRWSDAIGRTACADSVRWLWADDPHDEARSIADQIRRSISDGVEPEDIGVVARSLSGWSTPLRRAFSGAGVPFSGVTAEGMGAGHSRRMTAIKDCFVGRGDVDVGVWMTACGYENDSRSRLAFDSLGIRTVRDVVKRMTSGVRVALDARTSMEMFDDRVQIQRAQLFAAEVSAIHARASAFVNGCDGWLESDSLGNYDHATRDVLSEGIGMADAEHVFTALDTVLGQFSSIEHVSLDDWIRLVVSAIEPLSSHPIGGVGGGVAILDATEARGRTFKRLFLVGMNRGEFPRMVREDPMVPDAARRALQHVLPDLRLKKIGAEEERFLFAQLLSSAETVMLSCSKADSSGSPQHPSSFLVELQLHKVVGDPVKAVRLERPAWEISKDHGVAGRGVDDVFRDHPDHVSLRILAAARAHRDANHGPFLGEIGPVVDEVDPRRREMYVTTAESISQCPWQALLEKYLGIRERVDPFRSLPDVSGFLLGRVVHAVAERAVLAVLDEDCAEADDFQPLIWPSTSTLTDWIIEAADQCLAEDGIAWSGFSKAVVAPALRALEELQSQDATLKGVWGTERRFSVSLTPTMQIAFKSDRLDVTDEGVVLTDLKLGKPPTTNKTESSRRGKLLQSVRAGKLLQGVLYARALPHARGRYLYINPDIEAPVRDFTFEATDVEMNEALEAIVGEVQAAVNAGHFFPRVSDVKSDRIPSACQYCSVREACVVEDSAMRKKQMERMSVANESVVTPDLWTRGEVSE